MTNNDILRLHDGLKAVKTLRKKDDSSFAYAVARDIGKLAPVVKAIEETLKIPAGYSEYEQEFEQLRLKLCKDHAKKDANGKEITEKEGKKRKYVMEDKQKFDEDYQKLNNEMAIKYKNTFAEMKSNYDEYQKFVSYHANLLSTHKRKMT